MFPDLKEHTVKLKNKGYGIFDNEFHYTFNMISGS